MSEQSAQSIYHGYALPILQRFKDVVESGIVLLAWLVDDDQPTPQPSLTDNGLEIDWIVGDARANLTIPSTGNSCQIMYGDVYVEVDDEAVDSQLMPALSGLKDYLDLIGDRVESPVPDQVSDNKCDQEVSNVD